MIERYRVLVYSTSYTKAELNRIKEIFCNYSYYELLTIERNSISDEIITGAESWCKRLLKRDTLKNISIPVWLHIYIFCEELIKETRFDENLSNLHWNKDNACLTLILFKGNFKNDELLRQKLNSKNIKRNLIQNFTFININEIENFYDSPNFLRLIDNTRWQLDKKSLLKGVHTDYDLVIFYDDALESHACILHDYLTQNYDLKIWMRCKSLIIGKREQTVQAQIRDIIKKVSFVLFCINNAFLDCWVIEHLNEVDKEYNRLEEIKILERRCRYIRKLLLVYEDIGKVPAKNTFFNHRTINVYSSPDSEKIMKQRDWNCALGAELVDHIEKLAYHELDMKTRRKSVYDVYLLYHRSDFNQASMLYYQLVANKLTVWFDFKQMVGDDNDLMTDAVVCSDVIVDCSSAASATSDKRKEMVFEFVYKRLRGKPTVRLTFQNSQATWKASRKNECLEEIQTIDLVSGDGFKLFVENIRIYLKVKLNFDKKLFRDVFISTATSTVTFKLLKRFLEGIGLTYYELTDEIEKTSEMIKHSKLLICILSKEHLASKYYVKHVQLATALKVPIIFMNDDNLNKPITDSNTIINLNLSENTKQTHGSVGCMVRRLANEFYFQ